MKPLCFKALDQNAAQESGRVRGISADRGGWDEFHRVPLRPIGAANVSWWQSVGEGGDHRGLTRQVDVRFRDFHGLTSAATPAQARPSSASKRPRAMRFGREHGGTRPCWQFSLRWKLCFSRARWRCLSSNRFDLKRCLGLSFRRYVTFDSCASE
jgi:hypothetical protein